MAIRKSEAMGFTDAMRAGRGRRRCWGGWTQLGYRRVRYRTRRRNGLYFAMAFAFGVEMLNITVDKRKAKKRSKRAGGTPTA